MWLFLVILNKPAAFQLLRFQTQLNSSSSFNSSHFYSCNLRPLESSIASIQQKHRSSSKPHLQNALTLAG